MEEVHFFLWLKLSVYWKTGRVTPYPKFVETCNELPGTLLLCRKKNI